MIYVVPYVCCATSLIHTYLVWVNSIGFSQPITALALLVFFSKFMIGLDCDVISWFWATVQALKFLRWSYPRRHRCNSWTCPAGLHPKLPPLLTTTRPPGGQGENYFQCNLQAEHCSPGRRDASGPKLIPWGWPQSAILELYYPISNLFFNRVMGGF